jgi:hypothetical protein
MTMQANLGTNFISRASRRLILLMQKHATTDASSAHIVPPEQKEDIAALQRVLAALKGAAETPVAAQQGPRSGGHVAVTSILPFAEHVAHAKGMLAMLKAAPPPPACTAAGCTTAGAGRRVNCGDHQRTAGSRLSCNAQEDSGRILWLRIHCPYHAARG